MEHNDELRGYIVGTLLSIGWYLDNGWSLQDAAIEKILANGIDAARRYAVRNGLPAMGVKEPDDADTTATAE